MFQPCSDDFLKVYMVPIKFGITINPVVKAP